MIEIDATSLLVSADTDETISQLEESVSKEGYTLNYFTPPDNQESLADALEERLPNLYANAFGGIEDLCAQARWAHPNGEEYCNKLTPRSATGPSLKKFSIGSDQLLGTPIQATLRLFHRPAAKECAVFSFSTSQGATSFVQWLNKSRLPIPLWMELTSSAVGNFIEKIKTNENYVGVALWGEKKLVRALLDTLSEVAEQKKGRDFKIDREGHEDFLNLLRKFKAAQLKKERKSTSKDKGILALSQLLQRCS